MKGGGFRLHVLNPGGRDPEQLFSDTRESASSAHAPVNFHAYAACTGGNFYRETNRAIDAGGPVLLLLRGDFRASERALRELKKARLTVAVSLKETGMHQIAEQLRDRRKLERFLRIVRTADGCTAPTPEAAEVYRGIRSHDTVAFIPTPYPVHDPQWDFSRPIEERRGIFIGTREWDVPSRNHCAALLSARRISEETGEAVTVFDFNRRTGARLLAELGFASGKLRVLTERTSYADYLRTMGGHKIVFQLDSSFVPGQVAGDALLCRVPCVGGNGAIDRIAHPETCGFARSTEEVRALAEQLLREPKNVTPPHQLSFAAGAAALEEYFASIGA